MKNYTDLEQSKRLVKILPLESADIILILEGKSELTSYPIMRNYSEFYNYLRKFELGDEYIKHMYIPAWSLSALLSVLPSSIKDNIGMVYSLNMNKEYIEYSNPNISSLYSAYIHTCGNDNLVDACYEMIIKLHEQKLL